MVERQLAAALDPGRSVAVSASAGTGKTHLLITRIVRLLLEGSDPAAILAVTFTRKAASEMQQRLRERLYALASCPSEQLSQALSALQVKPSPANAERARALYAQTVAAAKPLRIQTFHAFCQDLLRRFPLDAHVSGDFEIVEATGLLQGQAWTALFDEATADPDGTTARALEIMINADGSLDNTRRALMSFLDHRADWLAFSEAAPDRVAHASSALESLLEPVPVQSDWLVSRRHDLHRYVALLREKGGTRYTGWADGVEAALGANTESEVIAALSATMLTAENPPKARQLPLSKPLREALGEQRATLLVELHDTLTHALLQQRLLQLDADYRQLARAWYVAGDRLLQLFQRIKLDSGALDFPDLEWHSAQLLHHAHDVDWIHFKLDERIDHILIDEFQDTNPGQWQLLTPLLEEMAAGGERRRSVFLVGDRKQSIYGFRRADPELQRIASDWITRRLGGVQLELDRSWRSTDAVISAVNKVFTDSTTLDDFRPHSSRVEGWGRVEVAPLGEPSPPPTSTEALRDPLVTAPPDPGDARYLREARMIADRIRTLVDTPVQVGIADNGRAVTFGDIMILVRTRTHVEYYEQALSARQIPYTSADRGTLLDTLEVRDVESLLTALIAPENDLALVHALRSPLFACDHGDLEVLASTEPAHDAKVRWQDRLAAVAPQLERGHPLARAQQLISEWRALADRVPVHDLLNHIYFHGALISRYTAALGEAGGARATRNLLELLNLSLRIDAGRAPSITRFLYRLGELRTTASDAPAEPPPGAAERVALMTIHAAKGLEAPVVFLADSCTTPQGSSGFETLVDWPAGADKPASFVLSLPVNRTPVAISALREAQQRRNAVEEQNLLYVAMTRARQLLVVSGTASRQQARDDGSWYRQVHDSLQADARTDDDGTLVIGDELPVAVAAQQAPQPVPPVVGSTGIIESPASAATTVLRPAAMIDAAHSGVAAQPGAARGRVIHKLLELLSEGRDSSDEALLGLADTSATPALIESWRDEARSVLSHPAFADYFDAHSYQRAWNEIPVSYRNEHGELVQGTIDRLVLAERRALVIDYKTQPIAAELAEESAQQYAPQLRAYVEGVQRLWPDHRVVPIVLYTHALVAVPLAV